VNKRVADAKAPYAVAPTTSKQEACASSAPRTRTAALLLLLLTPLLILLILFLRLAGEDPARLVADDALGLGEL
jgi:hypothetical protein